MREGATLLLTTQYLDEVDRLADDVVVLRAGRIAAQGAPASLKARVGGERLEVVLPAAEGLPAAAGALAPFASNAPVLDAGASTVVAPVAPGVPLVDVVRALDAAGAAATDVHRREATLDDVFLALTEPDATLEEAA